MPVIQVIRPIKKLPKNRDAARRAICRDVIAHLNTKKLIAETGTYGDVVDDARCQACALGSMFVTLTGSRELVCVDDDDMRGRLAPYFTRAELLDIETAFEGAVVTSCGDDPEAATRYRSGIGGNDEADTNLRYIMANIIRNGRFEPLDHRGPRAIRPFRS